MTRKRINELADFFYSSNNVVDVPLRLACETGRYSGFSLDKEAFIKLMVLLNKSKNLKQDFANFVEEHCE